MTHTTLQKMDKAQLAASYVELIGYDPFIDDPTIGVEQVRQILCEYAMIQTILDSNEIGTLIREGRTIYYANLKPLHLGVTVEGANELDVARRILAYANHA